MIMHICTAPCELLANHGAMNYVGCFSGCHSHTLSGDVSVWNSISLLKSDKDLSLEKKADITVDVEESAFAYWQKSFFHIFIKYDTEVYMESVNPPHIGCSGYPVNV